MGKSSSRKALNFDLDTKLIESNLSDMGIEKPDYHKAYYELRKYLEDNGFEHTQESAYTSVKGMTLASIKDLAENITDEIPYLKGTIKSMHTTSVHKTYDITEMMQNEHEIKIIDENVLSDLNVKYGIETSDNSYKRSIRFDFDGEALKNKFEELGIENNTTIAYDIIKKHFTNLGYEHKQGSVYLSTDNKTNSDIIEDVLKFSNEHEPLADCFSSFQITTVGRNYNITTIANGEVVNQAESDTSLNEEQETIFQKSEKIIESNISKDFDLEL